MNLTMKIGKVRQDGTMPVRIRLTHQYSETLMTTQWSVTAKDINRKGELKNMMVMDAVNVLMADWRRKAQELGSAIGSMTAKEIAHYLIHGPAEPEEFRLDIIKYAREDGDRLIAEGRKGTGGLRHTMANSLEEFLGKPSLDVNDLTSSLINRWVEWINRRPSVGTRKRGSRAASLYVAQLKAVFNRARLEYNDEREVRIKYDPFGRVQVSEPAPVHRSVSLEQLRAIMGLEDKPGAVRYNLAKDVFVLSFYLLGMNSADLWALDGNQREKGRITYERMKTRTRRADKALISVAIPDEAKPLVEKYRAKAGSHYFQFARMYSTIGTFSAALNKGLKDVGKEVGVDDLQFYAARHTWATIAYNDAKVDKGVVGDALNHVDGKAAVTDRYIRKDWSRIDEANRAVIDVVLGKRKASGRKRRK